MTGRTDVHHSLSILFHDLQITGRTGVHSLAILFQDLLIAELKDVLPLSIQF